MKISLAQNEAQIARCFLVMSELREQLTIGEFLERVLRQQRDGYKLVFLEKNGEVQSVAGFRLMENLAWGRFMYVDDLVTAESSRSNGFGAALFDWLVEYAREHNCRQLHLDSGVQRFGAHAFYLRKKMIISSHHFAMTL